jgi:hypothetical protein
LPNEPWRARPQAFVPAAAAIHYPDPITKTLRAGIANRRDRRKPAFMTLRNQMIAKSVLFNNKVNIRYEIGVYGVLMALSFRTSEVTLPEGGGVSGGI